jgi:formate hydrogenlyase transcriptional activator
MLDAVERIFEARSSWILLHDRRSNRLVTSGFRGPGGSSYAGVDIPTDTGIVGLAFSTGEPVFVPDVSQEDRWFDPVRLHDSGLPSVFTVPLIYNDERIGALGFYSPQFGPDALPDEADRSLVQGLDALASLGIRNARLFDEVDGERTRRARISQHRRQLRHEVGQLRGELRDARAHGNIIGSSEALMNALRQTQMVSAADTTVLLLGETGTGKELFARAIHDGSRRVGNVFVPVNCAAMPPTLLESELFGHEKGAFTGATERKMGKFELAHTGTLFLDEIGDLPLEAQAKLLRVLQDGQVHRLGGTKPVAVNVRVVAATNQDLAAQIQSGGFRPDLFYRLSVFPIRLPPLRERRGDVPLLASHFVQYFATRQHTQRPRITPAAMQRLQAYDWPGNVRELQNVVERAILVAGGGDILPEMVPDNPAPPDTGQPPLPSRAVIAGVSRSISLAESERKAILDVLEATGWRISGRGGAADLLDLKPTTLHAKMKKLGICRPGRSRAS